MLLAGVAYDPAVIATFNTTAAAAMAALDTTNLRNAFTVPANGRVAVKQRVAVKGATTSPAILLGILEGSTVRARHAGQIHRPSAVATTLGTYENVFVVGGLTPAASLTWDMACGVETLVASTGLRWGGPNNTTGNDAAGIASFEVWEAANCLAAVNYDPAVAVATNLTSALLAMTAMDTTNLRATFTTPASGQGSSKVLVRVKCVVHGSASIVSGLLGVLDGATVKMRCPVAVVSNLGAPAATDMDVWDASALVSVSPSTTYNWDMAYGVEVVQASTAIKYGGPNDTTADNAFGAASIEVWAAA